MQLWKPEYLNIADKLLEIMRAASSDKSVAEIDQCIIDYKKVLGELNDESEGLEFIIQLRQAKAEEQETLRYSGFSHASN